MLGVKYTNGDRFKVEFRSVASATDLARLYPWAPVPEWGPSIDFPVTTVEITERAVGTPIEFSPRVTKVGTNRIVGGGLIGGAEIGLSVEFRDAHRLFGDLRPAGGVLAFKRPARPVPLSALPSVRRP